MTPEYHSETTGFQITEAEAVEELKRGGEIVVLGNHGGLRLTPGEGGVTIRWPDGGYACEDDLVTPTLYPPEQAAALGRLLQT